MTKNGTLLGRMAGLTLTCAFVAAVACSRDSTLEPERQSSATQTPGNGDTSSTTPTPPATSNGPVASVVVSPKTVSLPQGYYTHLIARGLDAKGVAVAGKRAQWRSSNTNVAVASDTGVVYGKSLGSAKVYATIDDHTDSATITVTAPVTPPPPPPDTGRGPAPVASFALNVVAVGLLPGADTSATEPVAGTTIQLTRVAGVDGDTLKPSVIVGTATTNSRGEASFKDVAGGYYTILATPPAGSPYKPSSAGFSPPRATEVNVRITMRR